MFRSTFFGDQLPREGERILTVRVAEEELLLIKHEVRVTVAILGPVVGCERDRMPTATAFASVAAVEYDDSHRILIPRGGGGVQTVMQAGS